MLVINIIIYNNARVRVYNRSRKNKNREISKNLLTKRVLWYTIYE